MSNNLTLDSIVIANDDDPIVLNERFNALRAQYEQRRADIAAGNLKPPPEIESEIALAAWKKSQDEITANMISDQIKLIAVLRRTTQGPAKRGGKRAKKAPIDLDSMSDDLAKLA